MTKVLVMLLYCLGAQQRKTLDKKADLTGIEKEAWNIPSSKIPIRYLYYFLFILHLVLESALY